MPRLLVTENAKHIVAKVVDLFASPIHIEEMLFNIDSIREECYRRERDEPGIFRSNVGGYHSENYLPSDEFFMNLMLKIENSGNTFANHIGINPVKISNFWININRKGHYNQKHEHDNCSLSGVYYVKVPLNSGLITFFHPCEKLIRREWKSKEKTPFSSERWGFEPKENTLFIFPSWIDHMVHPNLSDEDRISISFNLLRHDD